MPTSARPKRGGGHRHATRESGAASYPVPLQVHLIWHPRGDAVCRPLADRIYTLLNRDPFQPLVPGIGIPVFFRSVGAVRDDPLSAPAPIEVPADSHDLRIALVTPDFVLDKTWKAYRDDCARTAAQRRNRATLVQIALGSGLAAGDDKVVVLDPAQPRTPELVLQNVLMQACRLLAHRSRAAGAATSATGRGAAPLKLFLSHTKRDKLGLRIALALKDYLDGSTTDRFFDDVSIQPGDGITAELEASIADSALVAIRTDGYVASPWCRIELALAKRNRRPMVVLDALSTAEPRSSSFTSNLASVRVDPAGVTDAQLDRAVNFVGLEVLRFLHAEAQLSALKDRAIVPGNAVLLARPPEVRDLVAAAGGGSGRGARPVFVHPDPVLSQEEVEEFKTFGVSFKTPVSVWSQELDGLRLGLSASRGDRAEEEALGLSPLHLEDASRAIARQALAAGATLVYGGALNADTPEARNLTEALHEMIGAYNKSGSARFAPLVNYTPWPWHQEVDAPWLAARHTTLEVTQCDPPQGIAEAFGAGDGPGHVGRLAATARGRYALARSLTAMRERITAETAARVVLGGKPHGFMGLLPGIVEETLLALRRGEPVYVAGGFGGAARLVAQAIRGERPEALTLDYQTKASPAYGEMLRVHAQERAKEPALPGIDYDEVVSELERCGVDGLAAGNGLSENENVELMEAASIDAALYLIMKGLAAKRRSSPLR